MRKERLTEKEKGKHFVEMRKETMAKNVDHNQMREQLIFGVVHAGAKFDIGGITNNTISTCADIKQAYIYRYFDDMNDLIASAFLYCDKNFFSVCSDRLSIFKRENKSLKEKFDEYISSLITYSLEDATYSQFYIKYYYSVMFKQHAFEEHSEICMSFKEKIKSAFAENANIDLIMSYVFTAFIGFVNRLVSDLSQINDEDRQNICDLTFNTIKPYIKPEYLG